MNFNKIHHTPMNTLTDRCGRSAARRAVDFLAFSEGGASNGPWMMGGRKTVWLCRWHTCWQCVRLRADMPKFINWNIENTLTRDFKQFTHHPEFDRSLLKLSPNGLLTPKTMQSALSFLNVSKRINFTTQPDDAFVDKYGVLIRQTFGKFRELFHNNETRRRCLTKVLGEQVPPHMSWNSKWVRIMVS